MKSPRLGASVLSVPFFSLSKKIKDLSLAKIDYFHIDVMDGNFVPNLSISPSLYCEIYESTPTIDFDLHFMVTQSALENLLPLFLKFPPKYLTIHLEAFTNWKEIAQQVRENGTMFGLAINPETSAQKLESFLTDLDMVLLMSVVPGYGGQKFINSTFDKLQILDRFRKENNLSFLIQVDGGINLSIAKQLVSLGTDLVVIGSDLINSKDPVSYIKQFSAQ
jgi:ribulose-phosphate 3-epimerase